LYVQQLLHRRIAPILTRNGAESSLVVFTRNACIERMSTTMAAGECCHEYLCLLIEHSAYQVPHTQK
jgi:hypothetical protein